MTQPSEKALLEWGHLGRARYVRFGVRLGHSAMSASMSGLADSGRDLAHKANWTLLALLRHYLFLLPS